VKEQDLHLFVVVLVLEVYIKVTVKILMREPRAFSSHDALSNLKAFMGKRESCNNIRNLLI